MDLRDHFAGLAMQALAPACLDNESLASEAYLLADAMLKARAKHSQEEDGGHLPAVSEDIDALCLTQRTTNILRESGVSKISTLLECSEIDLLKMKRCGKKSFEEIKRRVAGYGGLKR